MNSIEQYNQMIDSLTERGFYKRTNPERVNKAIGGGVIVGKDLGTREGFVNPKNVRKNLEIQNKIKKLFEQGKTNQQVADELKISTGSVKRIKKDLGLDTVRKTQLETIKEKYLKLKDIVEDSNKGFKYEQMKDLLQQAGLRGDYSPSDIKNMKKYNIPKLDSARDKVKKAFKYLTSNPNKPVEELFGFNSQISKLTGTNQNQAGMILNDLPEYKNFKPVMNKLNIPASRARLTGKNMVLADLIEEAENIKPTGSGGVPRGARSTPEYFIFDNAVKHVNQGGTKVEFTKMPGTLDETGKLISTTDAEFIYKGKKYTYDDLLKTGRKNFPEVYKAFDDLDEMLNRQVIHPVTKEQTNFSSLMKEAYNKGAGYSLTRSPYAIDHFKQVKEEPFTDLRITSARLNTSAGVLKQKEFEAKRGAITDPEKAKVYAPEKVKKNLKKMGYDFTKNPNKLFEDEVKLADDILLKKRILKKPIQIAQDYEKLQLENLKKTPGITTADKLERPEQAKLMDMFKNFNVKKEDLLEAGKETLGRLPGPFKVFKAFSEGGVVHRENLGRGYLAGGIKSLGKKYKGSTLEAILDNPKLMGTEIGYEGLAEIFRLLGLFAEGGRVGFKDGFDPKKRKTMKILGGLASIPVLGKYLKILGPLAPAVTETVKRGADSMPDFIKDLITKIKLKAETTGMKYFTGKSSDEFADVYHADGYTVTEHGNKTTIRKRIDDGEMLDKDMEMEIEYDPESRSYEYREATARPDAEGKLKDVEEYIEDVDLEEMKKYTYDE